MTEEIKPEDCTCVHEYHVPTKESLYDLAEKLATKHGFKSLPEAVMYAAEMKASAS